VRSGSTSGRCHRWLAAPRLEFTVHDTGMGIEPLSLDRLFEGFTQADTSTTRRFGGTGLGLGISRQLVELMGGTLTVQSTLSVGSSFTVRLPFEHSRTEVSGGSALSGTRVLVVDDGPAGARGLPALLARIGLDAVRAASAAEAPVCCGRLRLAAARTTRCSSTSLLLTTVCRWLPPCGRTRRSPRPPCCW
jgi:hypothetical protein